MNIDVHGIIALALANPVITLAILASLVVGFAIPWIAEAIVPMAEWSGWKFRIIIYSVAVLAGLIAGMTIWWDLHALVMWVPALAAQLLRDAVSHFFPWFSPRQQQVVIKRNAAGDVVGVKIGSDQTIITTPPKAPVPEDHQ